MKVDLAVICKSNSGMCDTGPPMVNKRQSVVGLHDIGKKVTFLYIFFRDMMKNTGILLDGLNSSIWNYWGDFFRAVHLHIK